MNYESFLSDVDNEINDILKQYGKTADDIPVTMFEYCIRNRDFGLIKEYFKYGIVFHPNNPGFGWCNLYGPSEGLFFERKGHIMAGMNLKKLALLVKENELDIRISVSTVFDGVVIKITRQINEYDKIATQRGVSWMELNESSDDLLDWLICYMIDELNQMA